MSAIVVVAIPGREELTERTLAELDERGGAAGSGLKRVLFWTSPHTPPWFGGWSTLWRTSAPMGGKLDFWWMLRMLSSAGDLVVLEDDVQPCRNLIPYLERWQTPDGAAFSTFFNGRQLAPGIQPPMGPSGRGFAFSQCLKLPATFVAFAAGLDPNRDDWSSAQDFALGKVAALLSLGVYYHRSLVQHVGEASVGRPGQTLTGKRAPAPDFVGADFDALELL